MLSALSSISMCISLISYTCHLYQVLSNSSSVFSISNDNNFEKYISKTFLHNIRSKYYRACVLSGHFYTSSVLTGIAWQFPYALNSGMLLSLHFTILSAHAPLLDSGAFFYCWFHGYVSCRSVLNCLFWSGLLYKVWLRSWPRSDTSCWANCCWEERA